VTTPLVKPLTREILVAGTAYKVTVATDRLTIREKGRRTGMEVTWDELLTRREPAVPEPVPSHNAARTPRAIFAEVAREVRAAVASLTMADEVLTQTGGLPGELLMEMSSDPTYGRAEQRNDWFVEPLLTPTEVASILRLSTRSVQRLPLRSIILNGQQRYRQSELREFLRKQETRVR
jgi:hypothetical protein